MSEPISPDGNSNSIPVKGKRRKSLFSSTVHVPSTGSVAVDNGMRKNIVASPSNLFMVLADTYNIAVFTQCSVSA